MPYVRCKKPKGRRQQKALPHIHLDLTSPLRNLYLEPSQAPSLARAPLGEARTGVRQGHRLRSARLLTHSVKISAAPERRFYAGSEATLPFCTSATQCTIKQN